MADWEEAEGSVPWQAAVNNTTEIDRRQVRGIDLSGFTILPMELQAGRSS
jgi:hypothetical protein